MRWIFSVLAVVLLFSWSLRWTKVEKRHSINGHASVAYKKDNWTGQTWISYGPPLGEVLIDIPLVIDSKRFDANDHIVNELVKHGKSGYLVDAWRKRDLATYIWFTLTILCLISSIIGFWRIKKREKNVGNLLN
ncbi:hypothetical protein [Robertmurraya sp.]|uniref:hypothetical protein n=1 Tax=Robertmurraya sp. TaxID=2837525 RepID=UPI00370436BA